MRLKRLFQGVKGIKLKVYELGAVEIREKVVAGELKVREIVDQLLERIAEYDTEVGAFVTVDTEAARLRADELDALVAMGETTGKLLGVPVAIKDNICVQDGLTTCGSKMLGNFKPPYSARVVQRLLAEGAVIIGKTNLDEFAMGSSTENSALQQTRNPRNTGCVPGGSSGGSAAAVAAGFVPVALGSDTGGSIRQPASYCGVVGMKPTYGAVSRYGLVAFGSSLDQIGPFARNVEDAALVLEVISGPDAQDSTAATEKLKLSGNYPGDLQGMKIGLPTEYFDTEGLSSQVKEAVLAGTERLRKAGAELVEIHLPLIKYAVGTYYIIATAEASSNLSRFDGVHYGHRCEQPTDIIDMYSRSREEGFGAEVKRRIMLGNYVLSAGYYDAYYLRALKVRRKIADDFSRAFAEVDLIASPVAPTTAFKFGEKTADPLAMYLSDIYTISANLAGIPGISVPCGVDAEGLPVGLQLLTDNFKDDLLFKASAVLANVGIGVAF